MAAYPLHSSHRRKDIRNWNGENLEVNTPHTLTEELVVTQDNSSHSKMI